MSYKADIQIAVKGANDLARLRDRIQDSAKAVDSLNVYLKAFSTNSQGVVRSINNLNSVASLAVKNFNEVALGTDEATVAARRYIDANNELNKGLRERANLVAKIKESDRVAGLARAGIRETTQYRGPIGPGQASALERIPDFGMGRQAGQSVPVDERIERTLRAQKESADLQAHLEKMEKGQTEFAKQRTAEYNKQNAILRAMKVENQTSFQTMYEGPIGPGQASPIMQGPQVSAAYQASFMEEKRKQRRINLRIRRERLQRRKNAAASAMIGGAFPLLFGQGAGAAAGGALGGGLGGLMGGQFGFALSLVGTNLGSLLDRLVQGASELGKAMGPFAQDTKAVTEALGMQGSVQEARLNLIEQTKGKTAAFNAAMKVMALEVGDRGVQALQQFGESARLMGGAFALLGTRLQALAAGFGNFILQITGVKNALEKGEARQIVSFAASQGNEEAQGLVQRRESLGQVTGSRRRFLTAKTAELTLDERIFAVREKISTQIDLLTTTQDSLLEDKRNEVKLNERIKELRKTESEGTAKEIASLEQKWAKGQEILDAKKQEKAFALFNAVKEGESVKEITLKEAAYREIVDKINKYKEGLAEAIGLTKSLNEETGKTEVKWEDIKEKIASGLTSAIQGLIDGTKSLGESLAGIARSIASMYLKAAITNILPMAEGGYVSNGIKPFSSGGMVTRPTLGLVGEAGEDEYIIPASKMAASMQRYSAGARGEAVIPGTGSSYAGGGAGGSTTVNYSGPILNFNSEEFVPKSAVGQIIASASARGASIGENRTLSTLKNSRSRRSALGL